MGSLVMGAENALTTPEHNKTNMYFWMENAKGRLVPVGVHREKECLRLGYIHTDRKVCSDDTSKRVFAETQSQDPMVRMAEAIEKIVDAKGGARKGAKATPAQLEALEKARAAKKKMEEAEEENTQDIVEDKE